MGPKSNNPTCQKAKFISDSEESKEKMKRVYPPARTDKVSPVKVGQIARTRDMKGVRVRRFLLFFQNHFLCSFLFFLNHFLCSFVFFFFDHWACDLSAHGDAAKRKIEKECLSFVELVCLRINYCCAYNNKRTTKFKNICNSDPTM